MSVDVAPVIVAGGGAAGAGGGAVDGRTDDVGGGATAGMPIVDAIFGGGALIGLTAATMVERRVERKVDQRTGDEALVS